MVEAAGAGCQAWTFSRSGSETRYDANRPSGSRCGPDLASRRKSGVGEEAVRAPGEVGVAEVDPDATVARDRSRLLVHPRPVGLVVGRVGVDQVGRDVDVALDRERHVGPLGARRRPAVPDRERVLGVEPPPDVEQQRGQSRLPERRSRRSRRRSDGPPGSARSGPAFSSATVVGPLTWPSSRPGQRPVLEDVEQPQHLLVGVGHARGVQQQHRAARVRRPRRRAVRRAAGSPPAPARPGGPRSAARSCSQCTTCSASVEREGPGVLPHRRRLRVGLQVEAGDHAGEARAGTAGGPVEIRVLLGVGAHQLAVGGDDVDRDDALAGPALAPGRSSPGRPAAGSRRSRRSRSGRPGRPGRARSGTAPARARPSSPGRRCTTPDASSYSMRPQGAEVDQQRVVVQAPGRPRVAAGAHADPPAALGGEPHAGGDVVRVGGLQHGRRIAIGPARVEDPADPGLLVAVRRRAGPSRPPQRRPAASHPTTAAPPSTGMLAPADVRRLVTGQEQDRVGDVLRLAPLAQRHPRRGSARSGCPGRAAAGWCAGSRSSPGSPR